MRRLLTRGGPPDGPLTALAPETGCAVAFTNADILLLERSIAEGRGARSIAFSEQVITFNSILDMIKLLEWMRGDVAAATTGGRYRLAATNKGI